MRRLYSKILVVFLPFILFYAFPMVCLFRAGELSVFDSFVRPLEEDRLFGLAYSYYDKEYKFYMTDEIKRPQVLALGSSRVLQLKGDIVKPGISFYNAGGAVQNIYEFRLFLKKLSYKPEIIIANFDQFYFNPNFEDQKSAFSDIAYNKPEYSLSNHLSSCITFYEDFMADKIDVGKLFQSDNTGITAIFNHRGFTTDGSYYDGLVEERPEASLDYNFKDTKERIRNKDLRFQGCSHADKSVLNEIDSLLEYCDRQGITFVGFLPPFAPNINDIMEADGSYGYLKEIPDLMESVFSRHHAVFMDFTDYENQYSTDSYFLDGFHGSDIVYNAMMADILSAAPQIQKYFIPLDSIKTRNDRHLRQHIKYHAFLRKNS